jgi:hypothetical protein
MPALSIERLRLNVRLPDGLEAIDLYARCALHITATADFSRECI